jgi:hypothetical protein
MSETPGTNADNPVFMRLIKDEEGIKWGNIVLGLVLTAASGYLASQSQKLDVNTIIKMRVAAAGERLGNEITKLGVALSIVSARAYDRARPI